MFKGIFDKEPHFFDLHAINQPFHNKKLSSALSYSILAVETDVKLSLLSPQIINNWLFVQKEW
jgi:hypothetical protein